MPLQSLDIVRRSATLAPEPQVRVPVGTRTVAKLIDTTKCIGCKACQVACMEWNDLRDEIGTNIGAYQNPPDLTASSWTLMRFAEFENPHGELEWLIRKDGCMHCADPGCLKACPSPGAIVQYSNGIVDFQEENCIGCGYCISGCPFNIPRISRKDHKVYKCTLCSDRIAVGLEPACIKTCPTGALVFGTKEDMKAHAAGRIEDLKSRGFANAGLYDPPGVGGTHVMYVLHHADDPDLYNGLPVDPHISRTVRLWKGAAKPIAVAIMGMSALAGFFHYIRVGPNETPPDEEARAHGEQLIERYTPSERTQHWTTALAFVLAALSGMALFHPALFGLSYLFGGGPWDRILHPYIALVMLAAFLPLASRMWAHNRMHPRDWQWLRQYRDVVNNREDRLPEVGRYNAGQKLVFWMVVLCLTGLLLSGIVMWRAYFSLYFPVRMIRLASVVHALCAFVLVATIIVHIYAAIWVKGSVRAMTRGTVTSSWARKHHQGWLREISGATQRTHAANPRSRPD